MPVDPQLLPLRVAERAGRLLFWVMQQRLPRNERDVALWFISEGDTYLNTIRGQPAIAAELGMSARTVFVALNGLEDRGLLYRQKRFKSNGLRTSDRARLIVPPELLELRTSAPERAAMGHEGEIDLSDYSLYRAASSAGPEHPSDTGDPDSAGPSESSGVARFAKEPSYQSKKRVEGDEGSSAKPARRGMRRPPAPRIRRSGANRQMRKAGEVFAVPAAATEYPTLEDALLDADMAEQIRVAVNGEWIESAP